MKINAKLSQAADVDDTNSLSTNFRRTRFERSLKPLILKLQKQKGSTLRILDVGGTASFWDVMNVTSDPQYDVEITTINVSLPDVRHPSITELIGDARDTGFADNSYDLIVSNSVIEHVHLREPSREQKLSGQFAMGREVERLAPNYYVQTPCRSFPIEPHYRTFLTNPLFPNAVRNRSLQRARSINADHAQADLAGSHLMRRRELAMALPNHTSVVAERIGPGTVYRVLRRFLPGALKARIPASSSASDSIGLVKSWTFIREGSEPSSPSQKLP